MSLAAIVAAVRHDGRARSVRCAAHDDHRASFLVSRGDDGRVLLHCHAGCAPETVLKADGMTMGRSKVYELLATGELPSIRIGGSVRVPLDALRTWIDRQLAERAEAK